MTRDEAVQATRRLGGLFPGQLTQEIAKWTAAQFLPFTVAAVTEAVDAHKAAHEFLNTPNLLEGIRAIERKESQVRVNVDREGSWCDVQRRLRPQLHGRSDIEVILRVHRAWLWAAAGGAEKASDGYRSRFLSSCRSMLLAHAGVVLEHLASWANTIEHHPADFQMVLDDLRGNPMA